MKKFIRVWTVLTLFVCMLCGAALAETSYTSGNYTYTINEDGKGCTITKFTGTSSSVTVPATLGGYKVTAIGSEAFTSRSYYLTSVNLSSTSVVSIGEDAFYNLSKLESVKLPTTLKTIGTYAFSGCSKLTTINLPAGLESIGSRAFNACKALTALTLPSGVETIGDYAFASCFGLTSVSLPALLTDLNYGAFYSCSGLQSVTFPAGLRSIGESAFGSCSSLAALDLPQGLETIGASAFSSCRGLTEVVIPDSVTSIGANAFKGCTALTRLTLSASLESFDATCISGCTALEELIIPEENENLTVTDGVIFTADGVLSYYSKEKTDTSYTVPEGTTGIGGGVFKDNATLTSIILPSTLKTIGNDAFYNCTGLTELTIPEGVTSIGDYAFFSSENLASISLPGSLESLGSYALGYCTGLTELALPDGLKSIGHSAFNNCTALTSLRIPAGVTKIEGSTFSSCKSLESVSLPAGLTSIGSDAFISCTALKQMNIPDGVTTIGYRAFENCAAMTSIHLPAGLTALSDDLLKGCKSLTELDIPDGLTALSSSAYYPPFTGCTGVKTLHLPAALSSFSAAYVSDMPISTLTLPAENTSFKVVDNVLFSADGSRLRYYPKGLKNTTYTVPAGVTSIGASAFKGNTSLLKVTIPEGVTEIDDYAFESCTSLVKAELPESATTFGYGAFQSCSSLELVNLPAALKRLESHTFRDCKSLASIDLPAGLTQIGSSAFMGCTSLTEISLPKSVTYIDYSAFQGCTSLVSAELPGVTSMSDSIFAGCTSLQSVSFPTSCSLGGSVFSGCTSLKNIPMLSKLRAGLFTNCTSLEKVVLLEDVYSMYDAFSGCTGLKDVYILNRSLSLSSSTYYFPYMTTAIHGYAGSTAETYAKNKGYTFISLSGDFVIVNGVLAAYNGSGGAVTIPSSVTEIAKSAFEGNTTITSVTIPGTVKTVGPYAFYNCDYMTSLTLGYGVTTLMYECFSSCNSLVDVTLPTSIREMGDHVFYSAYSLQEIEIPEGVTELPASCFSHAEALERVILPSTLTSIGDYAFNSCYALKTLTIPQNVTRIDGYAFYLCKVLETLYLPDGVESFGLKAFDHTPETLQVFCSVGSDTARALGTQGFYDEDYPGLKFVQGESSLSASVADTARELYILPEGVTSLGEGMFAGCEGLKAVVLPATVTEIADAAFDVLPETVYAPAGSFAAQWAGEKNIFTFDPAASPAVVALEAEIALGTGDTLDVNNLFRAEAAYLLENTDLTFAIADAQVASVENGVITALGTGETTLTVSLAADAAVSVSIPLRVKEKIESITLAESLKVACGASVELSAQSWTPETAPGEFVWTVEDASAAAIEGNILTATAQTDAQTTVTATAWNGVSASMPLTVYLPEVSAIDFGAQTVDAVPGDEIQLSCAVTDQHNTWTNQLVTFDTSDETVAMVDETGKVTVMNYGLAAITATAANGVSASIDVDARISLAEAVVTVDAQEEIVYTGVAQTPAVVVTLGETVLTAETDYTVAYANNIKAGTAAVTVTGAGKYRDTAAGEFVIAPKDLSEAVVTLEETEFSYTDGEIKPVISSVMLGEMSLSMLDYDVTYENNVLPGTAALTVTGKGNYTGSASVSFTITSVRRAKLPDSDRIVEWAPYVSDNAIHEGENHLFLNENLTDGFSVSSGETVYLDLNGYTIADSNAISVSGRLILSDSEGGGKITCADWTTSGCGILINTGGQADMYGGTITGYKYTESYGYMGGVYLNKNAVFNMYGGTITGNKAYSGGGISSNYGDVHIYGGTISNNTADYYGGGIYVYRGDLTISGGTISGNTSYSDGGGVYVGKGYRSEPYTFEMSGGEISGNTSTYGSGAGVYVYYTDMTFSGGRITGNILHNTSCVGAGLHGSNASFILTGDPVVTGNRYAGGAVYNMTYYATITGDFSGSIGVSRDVPYGGVSAAFAHRTDGEMTAEDLSCFVPDNASHAVYLNDEGKAVLGWKTYGLRLVNAAFDDGETYKSFAPGSLVIFDAVIPEGKIFKGWQYADGTPIEGSNTYLTFTMPMSDVTVEAVLVDEFAITDGTLTKYNGEDKAIIALPAGVTAIAEGAFDACTKLDTLIFNANSADGFTGALPEGVIGLFAQEGVLYGCLGAREQITLPDSITHIEYCAFPSGTLGVTGPNVVSAVFDPCQTLQKIDFPKMESVRDYAFMVLPALNEVHLDAAQTIGEGAFMDCAAMTAISLPGAQSIGASAFSGCRQLASVDMPNVTTIGPGAFVNCAALAQIDLTGVTSIGKSAFKGTGLTQAIVPDSVTSIGSAAFDSGVLIVSSASAYARTWAAENGCAWEHDVHTEEILEAVEATCTEDGLTEGLWCPVCEKIFTAQETITAPGHVTVTDEAVEPTCTETGLTEGSHCEACSEVFTAQEEIPALGHTEAALEGFAPTCTEPGLTDCIYCEVCSEELEPAVEIPAAGHTEATLEGFAPTCTEPGLTDCIYCEVCGEELEPAAEIPAEGHNEEISKEEKAPTCTEDGWTQEVVCGVCHEVLEKSEPITSPGHKVVTDAAVLPTCTETGLTEGSHCEVCSEVLTAQEVVPALGHDPVTDAAVLPTDRETGLTEGSHCGVCGEVLVAQEIVPANFTFDGDTVTAYNGTAAVVVIPDGTTALGNTVFKNNTTITSVTVPDSVTAIGTQTFYGCTALEDVILPDHLTNIGVQTFSKVTARIHVGAESDTAVALSYRSIAFTAEDGLVLRYRVTSATGTPSAAYVVSYAGDQASVTIPETLRGAKVTQILTGAFANQTQMTSIVIPAGVTTIADDAFDGCSADLVIISAADAYAREWAKNKGFAWAHDRHTEDVLAGVEATCTEAGLTEGLWCAGCGEIFTAQEEIPAKGHEPKILPGVEATCTEPGLTEGEICTVCKTVTKAQEEIPAKGHEPEILPGVEATCTEPGLTEGEICTVCKTVTKAQEEIPAKGHEPEILPGVEATCTEVGYTEGEICTVCKTVTKAQEEIPAKGHEPQILPGVEATCTEVGYTEGEICTVCKTVTKAQEEIPAKGHEPEILPGVEATCTEVGYTEGEICTVCKTVTKAQEEIPAKGHEPEILPGIAPTHLTTGLTEGEICTICETVITAQQVVPELELVVISLPQSLKSIEANAFAGTPFGAVEIPEGCETIGSRAFARSANLRVALIPASVTQIADDAFEGHSQELVILTTEDAQAAIAFAEEKGLSIVYLKEAK